MTKKIFVLDTSALVYDPYCFRTFENSEVIIPITILDELDKLKKQSNEAGKNARVCVRVLEDMFTIDNIKTGVLLNNNINIKLDPNNYLVSQEFGDALYGDTRIVACAEYYKINESDDTTLVSNDINLRLRAKALGINAIECAGDRVSLSELYMGHQLIKNSTLGYALLDTGYLNPQDLDIDLNLHECVAFLDEENKEISLGRKVSRNKIKLIKKTYPWGLSSRNKEQSFAIDLIQDKGLSLVSLIGKAGTGKTLITLATALDLVLNKKEYDKLVIYRPIQSVGNDIGYLPGPQPLDAKILTPDGWITMGELKVGDSVISRDGKPTKVLNIYPKGTKDVYKITTSDGLSTECCEDHLWKVKKSNEKNWSIVQTKDIIKSFENKENIKYILPRNEAIHYNKKELPFPAYSLGVFLGDGSATDGHITYYSSDQSIIDRVDSELKIFDCRIVKGKSNKLSHRFYSNKQCGIAGCKEVKITDLNTGLSSFYKSTGEAAFNIGVNRSTISENCKKKRPVNNRLYEYTDNVMASSNPIIRILKELNLYGKKSYNKFIPKQYLYASLEDRIDLLRGLMDTDGCIKKSGEMSFCTSSEQLANDIIELIRSLGGRASLHSRNRIGKFNIVNNNPVISKRITYEFTVSLPGNIKAFFLKRKANNHNPNKNPMQIKIKSINYVGKKEVQCILIENPEHLYITDDFIVTHNTMEEKLSPWFEAIMDNLEVLLSSNGDGWKKNIEMFKKKGQLEMQAITYIRGRSIPNSIILIDEAQNLSKEEMKTILTRAGEDTKIILTGDIEQIDNKDLDATNNGLTYVIDKFKESNLAGHITFTVGERSKLATIASEIL